MTPGQIRVLVLLVILLGIEITFSKVGQAIVPWGPLAQRLGIPTGGTKA